MKSTRGSPEQAEGQIGADISSGTAQRGGNAKMQIIQTFQHSIFFQEVAKSPVFLISLKQILLDLLFNDDRLGIIPRYSFWLIFVKCSFLIRVWLVEMTLSAYLIPCQHSISWF